MLGLTTVVNMRRIAMKKPHRNGKNALKSVPGTRKPMPSNTAAIPQATARMNVRLSDVILLRDRGFVQSVNSCRRPPTEAPEESSPSSWEAFTGIFRRSNEMFN